MAGERDVFDIERVAALARLWLTPDERALYQSQLADILAYVRRVEAVDTTGVPPAGPELPPADTGRPDDVRPPLSADAALANAPDVAAAPGLVRVPKVLGPWTGA
jgi:aspartyl-tRNA(Asn)/glutamyl-tRNA(Gln) amidotransferase subunit C